VDGSRLLDDAWRDAARTTEHRGEDRVQPGVELHVGLGFRLPTAAQPLLGPGSFGHTGTGGAIAAALPEAGLAVAFLPNRLHTGAAEDTVRSRLLDAARAAC
jgi:CubicO group peptidase (beta-lactamase class C family)